MLWPGSSRVSRLVSYAHAERMDWGRRLRYLDGRRLTSAGARCGFAAALFLANNLVVSANLLSTKVTHETTHALPRHRHSHKREKDRLYSERRQDAGPRRTRLGAGIRFYRQEDALGL
jgi:hypothetical protein